MVTAINAAEWSEAFTAVRSFRPSYDLKALKTMRVPVVPASQELEILDRQGAKYDPAVDVGVMKKIAATDDEGILAEIDANMAVVQAMIDFCLGKRFTGASEYICIGASNVPIYSVEHLDRFNQFTSVIRFAFRGRR